MLEVKDLNAGYRTLHILFDIGMRLDPGEVVVLVGPNGSGKSTLLKSLFGLTTIYSGSIVLEGKDLTHLPPHFIAGLGIAYLPQVENVFEPLTVNDNLRMAGYICRADLHENRERALELFPMLKGKLARKAQTLSGGERQMLAMAMAVVRDAKYICFDEPTANLAPRVGKEVFDKILQLRDSSGIGAILVEQNARRALEICDRAYLLVGGKISFEGRGNELLSHPELGRLYLGVKVDVPEEREEP